VLDRLMAEGHKVEAQTLESNARRFAGQFKTGMVLNYF